MPRNYKRKKDPELIKNKLDEAVLKVEVDNLSMRAAAKEVDIPFSTLQLHMQNLKNKVMKRPVGAPLSIPETDENELAACLKCMAKWGFPLSRAEIKLVVAEFISKNMEGTSDLSNYLKRYCQFKNNVPGDEWLSAFLARHNLSNKKPRSLEKSRVLATSNPYLIYEFYDLLENELDARLCS